MSQQTRTTAQRPPVGNEQALDPLRGFDPARLIAVYRNALAARFVDAKILVLLKQGKAFFHIGGSGHEIAQTAVALAMKPGHDWACPYYRDLAFSLQYGYTVRDVLLDPGRDHRGRSTDPRLCRDLEELYPV